MDLGQQEELYHQQKWGISGGRGRSDVQWAVGKTVKKLASIDAFAFYGVITHLEPDILECKVKWAIESITTNKANGGDGIPVELFQILKDDAVKVLHSICQQIWKTQQWPQDWKSSVFIPIPKKGNAKECSKPHSCIHLTH